MIELTIDEARAIYDFLCTQYIPYNNVILMETVRKLGNIIDELEELNERR